MSEASMRAPSAAQHRAADAVLNALPLPTEWDGETA